MIDGQPLELVLVKNPAGFTVALGTYGSTPVATMIAPSGSVILGSILKLPCHVLRAASSSDMAERPFGRIQMVSGDER